MSSCAWIAIVMNAAFLYQSGGARSQQSFCKNIRFQLILRTQKIQVNPGFFGHAGRNAGDNSTAQDAWSTNAAVYEYVFGRGRGLTS